jgi:hypothetical protein
MRAINTRSDAYLVALCGVALGAASSSDSSLELSELLALSLSPLCVCAACRCCAVFMSVLSSSLSSELLEDSAACSSATTRFGVTFFAGTFAATVGLGVCLVFFTGFGVVFATSFVILGWMAICTGAFCCVVVGSSPESSSLPMNSWLNALLGGRTLVWVFGLGFGCRPGSGTWVFRGLLIANVALSRSSLEARSWSRTFLVEHLPVLTALTALARFKQH